MSFKIDDEVKLDSLEERVRIIDKIGEGGQGVVYKVGLNGKEYALKWYLSTPKNQFYNNLKKNIENGAPNDSFLWPLYITEKDRSGKFGYIMKLRPPEYLEFSQFLLGKAKFSNVVSILNAASSITKGFRELHKIGYSYQDINDGNFFINPKSGDVLICDNDNVAPNGVSTGIIGKCRYMAPEVISGANKPNSQSDRFSLSVMLFLLLFGNHPLEGKKITSTPCLTEDHEKRLYGNEAVFIYDSLDDSNRPVQGIHQNVLRRWGLYPRFVQEIFEEAFNKEVLSDPNRRIIEKDWMTKVFQPMYHKLIRCPRGHEQFIDVSENSYSCAICNENYERPPLLKIDNTITALVKNKKVHKHLVSDKDDYNGFDHHIGTVIESSKHPGIFGLKNQTKNTWTLTMKDKTQRVIEPDKVAPLLIGNIISFGNGFSGEVL